MDINLKTDLENLQKSLLDYSKQIKFSQQNNKSDLEFFYNTQCKIDTIQTLNKSIFDFVFEFEEYEKIEDEKD